MKSYASPGTPARYDKVGVIKVGSPRARNVLVLEPGTSAAAAYFVPLAQWVTRTVPGWQVWAVQRRESLLEDQSVLDLAKRHKASTTEVFNYYLGFLADKSVTHHMPNRYLTLSPPYAKRWGMTVAVNDVRTVIRSARKLGGKVVLGGHSLGGSVVTAYATWDFHGHAGANQLAGLVFIDGAGGFAESAADAQAALTKLNAASSTPWLSFGGIGAPFAGIFNDTGAMGVIQDPNGPSLGQEFPLLPSDLKPPVRVTNEAQYGYALNYKTSPPALIAAQGHLGTGISSHTINGAHTWNGAGALTPITRFATMFGAPEVLGAAGTEWYFPQRLTDDTQAVNNGIANPAQAVLDVHSTMGRKLPHRLRMLAFGAALGGPLIGEAADALAKQSGIPLSHVTKFNYQSSYSHNDPNGAYPAQRFLHRSGEVLAQARAMKVALPPGPRTPAAVNVGLFALRPLDTLLACQRRYGNVFTVKFIVFGTGVYVAEPDAIKELLTGDQSDLLAGEANSFMAPVLGSHSVLVLDGPEHMRQRKLLLPPFQGSRIDGFREVVREVAEREVSSWRPGQRLVLRERMRALTFEVISRAVFGVTEPAQVERLRRAFGAVLDLSPLYFVSSWLRRDLGRWSPGRRFVERLRVADQLVLAEIGRRRAEPDLRDRADVLSLLLRARDEEGRGMSDAEVRDELFTMLAAGHETTATELAFAFELLMRNPAAGSRLRDELEAGRDDSYLDAVVKETLAAAAGDRRSGADADQAEDGRGLGAAGGHPGLPRNPAHAHARGSLSARARVPARAMVRRRRRVVHVASVWGRDPAVHRGGAGAGRDRGGTAGGHPGRRAGAGPQAARPGGAPRDHARAAVRGPSGRGPGADPQRRAAGRGARVIEELVRRLYEALATGDSDAVEELLAPDFQGSVAPGMPFGLGGQKDGMVAMRDHGWWAIGREFSVRVRARRVDSMRRRQVARSGPVRGPRPFLGPRLRGRGGASVVRRRRSARLRAPVHRYGHVARRAASARVDCRWQWASSGRPQAGQAAAHGRRTGRIAAPGKATPTRARRFWPRPNGCSKRSR